MLNLELFQIYHLKEMSLSAELFLSCSILQFTFYAVSTAYQRRANFVLLNKQVYYVGSLLLILSLFLLLNEELFLINPLSSNNFVINDYLSFVTKLTICLASTIFLTIINVAFRNEPLQNNFEYVILITISILGLLLLCSANDLITAYLAIELHSLAFYIMSAFKRNSSYSIESGLKYFIIGALSSAFFLFGSSLIYGCTGSFSFDDLRMFFSLLSVNPTINTDVDYVILEFSFLSTTLFSSSCIGENLQTMLPQPYCTTSDNLIDWFTLNYETQKVSTIFPGDFLQASSNEDFLVYPIFSYFITDFLTSIFILDWVANKGFDCGLLLSFKDFSFIQSLTNTSIASSLPLISAEESIGLLKSISDLYITSGASNQVGVNSSMLNTDLISIGFFLICVSLFIKLSIAPFHFWSLDVYEGSPNSTTFFFAVVPKISLFVLLTRFCYVSFFQIFVENFQFYFFCLAALSIFVGSLGGLEQRKLKTLMAYSSISHTGYLLLAFSTGNSEGVEMLFYYLALYMLAGLSFWSVYLFLVPKRVTYSIKDNRELADLVLLNKSNPMLALILALTLFSMAGIPPIIGFLAKVGIFLVVVKVSAYLVSVVSIVLTVISTFYYIRFIKILYFENSLVGRLYLPVNTQKSLLIAILALSLIVLCVNPTLIYLFFYKAFLLTS